MHELYGPPVRDLFVAANEVQTLSSYASTLPRLDIDMVDMQWLQVVVFYRH